MINLIFNMYPSLIFSSKVSFRESLCGLTSPFHAAYKGTGGGNETVGFKLLLSRCHLFSSCDIGSHIQFSKCEDYLKPRDRTVFLMEPNVDKGFSNESGATEMELVKRDFVSLIFPGVCQPGKDKSTSTF